MLTIFYFHLIAAHTTQFTKPGWTYYAHGSGVGNLTKGGSYVSFLCPMKKDLTIVIQTMVSSLS